MAHDRLTGASRLMPMLCPRDLMREDTNTDTELPDFEGVYTISGTLSGRDGPAVEGTLEITGQTGGTAYAALAVKLMDHGNTFFALNMTSDAVAATALPAKAHLAEHGEGPSFSLVFSGKEEIPGIDPADCFAYTLSLDGTLSGDTISGTWALTTNMPSSDSGTFTATHRDASPRS